MGSNRTRWDIIAAQVIGACSALCCVYAYALLEERGRRQERYFESLTPGPKEFRFFRGAECIGKLRSELTPVQEDHSTILKIAGEFKAYAGALDIPAGFDLYAEFNSLGQLGASIVKLSAGDHQLTIGTTRTNPISIKLRFRRAGEEKLAEYSVPGPVELRRNGDGGYDLLYPPLERQRRSAPPVLAALLGQLQLTAVSGSGSCDLAKTRGLDAEPLIGLVSVLQSVNMLKGDS